MANNRVLVVDDEAIVRMGVADYLRSCGFEVEEAGSCSSALSALLDGGFDLAIIDYALPDGTALDILREHRIRGLRVPMIVLTGYGSITLAVQAMQEGAEHFLTKPVEFDALLAVVRRVIDHHRDRRHVAASEALAANRPLDPFLGGSDVMQSLAKDARQVAATDTSVLIQGETGTGKGVLARWIHQTSARSAEPWVELNCATLERELLESELFGHDRGAFTGATSAKVGLIEAAHRGTVFLDEIGDLDLSVQAKLLKVIEDKRFRRLGEVRERSADVRFIVASHRNLAELVDQQRFRQDLLFRLNAITLTVPPLRERVGDIAFLAERFLRDLNRDRRQPATTLTPAALEALEAYQWPGNVRELHNVLERAMILNGGGHLGPRALRLEAPAPVATAVQDASLTLEELQIQYIERVLAHENGNIGRVALRLGVPRSTLYQRINKYGLRQFKSDAA